MSVANELVRLGVALADVGLTSGQAGNISARDGDQFVATPTNASLARLDPAALSILDARGALVDGPRQTKETSLHLAMYERNPDAGVVVHVHSPAATAVSCLEPWSTHTAIAPFTPYVLMKVGQVPLIPYRAPGDPTQAELLTAHPFPFRGALLANHGSIVAARDAESALAAAIEIEEACRVMLQLRDFPARQLSDEQITDLVERADTPWTPAELRVLR